MNLQDIQQVAMNAAITARDEYLDRQGGDVGACGFAWVSAFIDGRSKAARQLKKIGFTKSWEGGLILWNPASGPQSVDALEAGARAYAEVLRNFLGIKEIYAGSRLD